jgi:polyisoprenoid-binding protein YceI
MYTLILSAALALTPLFGATDGATEPSKQTVSAKESSVTWIGKKVTGSHSGDIMISNGFISVQDGMVTGASVIIDMTSINTTDLEGGSKESLDGHLKSDDFFGVEQFPTAQFELISLNPLRAPNGMNFTAQGTVTIKGRTAKVAFPVKVEMGKMETTISGEMTLDRSNFDVRFRSKSFFDAAELGDKLIYDDFTIGFTLKTS